MTGSATRVVPPPGAHRWPIWVPWSLAAVVAASRLLLMPDGPWEQDEAIFAAGVLDYSVTAHRPHPPGFPGWIALGKLLHPLVGDPLLALRLWSCAASVALFVLGAACLRRLVSDDIAWAAAFAHAFLPGVWFHAPRAFATTPALAFVVLAIWLWLRPVPRRVALGFVAAAFAILVRPQLLPLVVVVTAGAAWYRRRLPRAVVLGLVAGAAAIAVAAVVMVIDTGGLGPLLDATGEHFRRNARASGRLGAFEDLGLVRSLGGVVPTVTAAVVVVAGSVAWARRDRAGAVWFGGVLVVSAVTILTTHPPQLPRYAVVVATCLVPPVAMLAQAVGRLGGLTLLLGIGAWGAWSTADAMLAAHRTPLPVVAALRALEGEQAGQGTLVHSHGLFAFVRLSRMQGRLQRRSLDEARLLRSSAELEGPYDVLGGKRRALPGATVQTQVFDAFPEAAWNLSQRRFDRVHLTRRPVFVEAPVRSIERDRNGEPFVWLAPVSKIRAQPNADRVVLVMLVAADLAPLQLDARVGEGPASRRRLDAGLTMVSLDLGGCTGACLVELEFADRLQVAGDPRALTARLYGAWCEGPGFDVPAFSFGPGHPRDAAARGVTLDGFFAPERFTPERIAGAWTNGHATMRWRGGPGRLTVKLAQPPPRDPIVRLRTHGATHEVSAGATPSEHVIDVVDDGGVVSLEIEGQTLSPSSYATSSADPRELGPIVFSVRYEPASRPGS